jgi:dienelactone hydrolase
MACRGSKRTTLNLLTLALLCWLPLPPSVAAERALIPWQPGNAVSFQSGTVEEKRARSKEGSLPATIYRPAGERRFPFVVLLHGCGGLGAEAMWTRWVQPWADLFLEQGVGVAVVDSFANRGVDQVCTRDVGAWAVRRADDAYSARGWLAQQSYVDAQRIAVMGMSNGGRTVLAALRAPIKHSAPFLAGVALYPGCQSDLASRFYAPLLVLTGKADTAAPAHFCERMKAAQGDPDTMLTLVVYPRAPHTFDMRLPDRTVLGMQLGYDAEATSDARRRVIDFLATHGGSEARIVTKVSVIDADGREKVLSMKEDLSHFERLWFAKIEQTPPADLKWTYKLDVTARSKGDRWLYDTAGWVRILSMRQMPVYKISSVDEFNRLVGIE